MTDAQEGKLLTIGEVSALTGVNSVTLRAWQRRFGLVIPMRTPKGHRLYTSDNIAQIMEITRWLEKGVAISKVKPLLGDGIDADSAVNPEQNTNLEWQQALLALTQATILCQGDKMQRILDGIFSVYPLALVTQQLLEPWQQELERLLSERVDGPLLHAWLQDELTARFSRYATSSTKPSVGRVGLLQLETVQAKPVLTLALHWEALWFKAALNDANISVLDFQQQAIETIALIRDDLELDALLIMPGAHHSNSEVQKLLDACQRAAFPMFVVGRLASTLPQLNEFLAPSVAQLLNKLSVILAPKIPLTSALKRREQTASSAGEVTYKSDKR